MTLQAPEISGIPDKVTALVATDGWMLLEEKFRDAQFVLFIGNGGNLAVAQHAASDVNRLTDKFALSPTNLSHITSVACEKGIESWLTNWIHKVLPATSRREKAVVIGFSCSSEGVSARSLMDACSGAANLNIPSFLLTAQPRFIQKPVNEICVNATHYHTAELIYTISFYQLIASSGITLPAISGMSDHPEIQYLIG